MKFSLNWIKEFVDVKETPQKIAELLTLKSFEVKEINEAKDDVILDIDILPNRPDCLSHFGLARELAVIFGRKLPAGDYKSNEDKTKKARDFVEIVMKDKELCPRYSARVITEVRVGESPKWLKERLESLGLSSINNVVDAANYVMLELGQPLHAFDYDKLGKGRVKVIVRRAKKGEKIKVLDEARTEYELSESDLVIADAQKPIAIAGIKGGASAEIDDSTKTIILESANFDKSTIRLTSQRLGLNTDASLRFTYGVDLNLTAAALDRVVSLIGELAGGKISQGIEDVYSRRPRTGAISLSKEYIIRLLGEEIQEKESRKILESIGCKVEDKKDKFLVAPPGFRLDLNTQEDLIEEISRIYGYDRIRPKTPEMGLYPETPEIWRRGLHLEKYGETEVFETSEEIGSKELIRDILASLGFSEIYGYSFISDEDREIFSFSAAAEVLNPISYKFRYLRPNLLVNLLKTAQNNLKFYQDARLFEIGRIFKKADNQGIEESRRIGGIIAAKKEKGLFFELKGLIDTFLNRLRIAEHFYDDVRPFAWPPDEIRAFHPGVFAQIKLNGEVLGVMGEINPHILSSVDSGLSGSLRNVSAVVFELDFEKLFLASRKEREYRPLSKYPTLVRDISILIDKDVRISEILNKIEGADTKRIVQDVDVFDIYEDSPDLPEGKKSVAFHVIFQSEDHTLTDGEADEVEANIKKVLEESLEAEIR